MITVTLGEIWNHMQQSEQWTVRLAGHINEMINTPESFWIIALIIPLVTLTTYMLLKWIEVIQGYVRLIAALITGYAAYSALLQWSFAVQAKFVENLLM